MISWNTCKEDFRGDGSLRDIYITPSTLADWRTIYPLIRAYPEIEYSVDGTARQLPNSVEEAFETRRNANPMLRFRVGAALIVFHFFTEDEIECDFVPNEITSQSDLDTLLAFVQQLGNATRKRVIITPENRCDEPFISYAPKIGNFEYHTPAS